MNMKTKMHFLVNPGVLPAVTFVTCYEPADEATPAQAAEQTESTVKSAKRNWTRAVSHLPKVFGRVARQTL